MTSLLQHFCLPFSAAIHDSYRSSQKQGSDPLLSLFQGSPEATLCFPESFFFFFIFPQLAIKSSDLSTHSARIAPSCLSDTTPQ